MAIWKNCLDVSGCVCLFLQSPTFLREPQGTTLPRVSVETILEGVPFLKGSMLRGFGNSAERKPHHPFAMQKKWTKRPCSLSEARSVRFCSRTHGTHFMGVPRWSSATEEKPPGGLYSAAKPGVTSHPQDPTLMTRQPPSEPTSNSQA